MTDNEILTKKPRIDSGIPPATAAGPITCAYWVQRKKRNCKIIVANEGDFCGEHKPTTEDLDEAENGDRIPCPLDSKHTVYKKNLQKHLKICNARPTDHLPPYIQKNVNAGQSIEEKEELNQFRLNELSDEEFHTIVEKVKNLYSNYVDGRIEDLECEHPAFKEELSNEEYGKETRKHLRQAAALLAILEVEGQLQKDTSYIEFGAGKGQLAFYLAQQIERNELTNSQIVLVDRLSLRHKKDNKIEDRSLVHRIRTDIADFNMAKLELLKKTKRNVAISKHLCGSATDLTLRCLTQPESAASQPTEFVMIALCCHHRCDWATFVGKEFFQTQKITAFQFAIMTKMASWAICGTGMSRATRSALEAQNLAPKKVCDLNTAQRLTLTEREGIGSMCKRLIDYARLLYLQSHGFTGSLKHYVSEGVTLENTCLLARKN